MEHTPLISVLMAVYNGEQYLRSAVESILQQTLRDFELIIVDDGSADGTPALLASLARQDERIRIISQANQGLVASLNSSMELARAELIARMDGDDLALPDRFARQVEYLEHHPECGALGTRVLLIDPEGDPLRVLDAPLTHEEIEAAHLSGRRGSVICHPTAMLRKDIVRRAGGWHQPYLHVEDIDLFLRMGEISRVANLPEVLLHYRQHPNSTGYQHTALQRERIYRAAQEGRQRRGLPALAPDTGEHSEPGQKDVNRRWRRWAYNAGNYATALKYARKDLHAHPASPQAWWWLLKAKMRGGTIS